HRAAVPAAGLPVRGDPMTVVDGVRVTATRSPAVRRRRFLIGVAEHSVLIGAALLFLLPFVFIALTSLMTNDQALTSKLWPDPFRWRNYYDIFDQAPLLRWLGTT